MMRLVLVAPPVVEPLTAEEARQRLKIDAEVSDGTLDAYIVAARQQLDGPDGWLGRCLNTQTWRGSLDAFPCNGKIDIPLPPLQEILSIDYIGAGGSSVTIDPSDYQIVPGARPFVVPAYGGSWPSSGCQRDAVTIEFIAGYGDSPDDVPAPIRQAIALMVSDMRSLSSQNLFLSEDRVEGIGSKRYVVGDAAAAALSKAIERLIGRYRMVFV